MKFYIRELPQQQYHYQSYDLILSKNATPKPGDTWHSNWSDYHIDRVTYSKDGLVVYTTITKTRNIIAKQ
jgi:hypothetical protein